MALSTTVLVRSTQGRQRKRVVEITFDSSYNAGGEALTGDHELGTIDAVDFSHARLGAAYSANVVRYDAVNAKLLVYTSAGVEVTAATDLSTFVATLEISGR